MQKVAYPPSEVNLPFSKQLIAELRGAHRLARYRALDAIEAEIERLYPDEVVGPLLDPQHDWEV